MGKDGQDDATERVVERGTSRAERAGNKMLDELRSSNAVSDVAYKTDMSDTGSLGGAPSGGKAEDPYLAILKQNPLKVDEDPIANSLKADDLGNSGRSKSSDLIDDIGVDLTGLDFDQRVAKLAAAGYTADKDPPAAYYGREPGSDDFDAKQDRLDGLLLNGMDYKSAYLKAVGPIPADGTPWTMQDEDNAHKNAMLRKARKAGLSDRGAHAAAGLKYHKIEHGIVLE